MRGGGFGRRRIWEKENKEVGGCQKDRIRSRRKSKRKEEGKRGGGFGRKSVSEEEKMSEGGFGRSKRSVWFLTEMKIR